MIADLYSRLKKLKVVIKPVDGKLDIKAPKGVLNSELMAEISRHKEELITLINSYQKKNKLHTAIDIIAEHTDYAVSDGQRRLWLLSQQEGSSRAYHISGNILLEGAYDAAVFGQAINHAMARHEILRTVFRVNEAGELRQVVLPVSASGFRFTSVDATQYTKEEIAAHLDTQATQVFDLANGPLLRAGLLHTGEQRYILHFNLHHIISDGWSMELLSREVLTYYECLQRGEVPVDEPLRIQYKDYAAWQQQQLSGADFTADRHYWEEQLSGELPVLALPSEKVRPAVLTYNGYALSTVIDEQTVADLQALCTRHQSTLFMGLLGVLNGLLYRYSGQEDIIIGSPVAGRGHGELEDQLGFYVNTLALRTRFDGRSSFASLLEAAREVTLAAYEHQQYPFDRLVDDLNIRRDMSRSVVFDVMMALQQQEAIGDGSAVTGEIMEKGNCAVKLDLHISFITSGGRLYMDMQYNSDVFEKATMVRLMDHFRRLLMQVIATPDMPVSRLAYLSATEEQQLLDTFNDTAVVYPSGVTLQELFQRQVATHGDKVALIHKGQSFNYHQLDTLSGQLCNYLKEKYQVQPGELIGVKLHRSEWLIISLLSVLKTGGAYVPMDPSFPADRIDYILSDSGSRICIDDTLIADFVQQQAAYAGTWELPATNEDSLAYVLYTSGSTGRPKGCMLGHKGVVNRLEWMWRTYAFTGDDAVLQKTTFTFDVSVWEIFLPLCWGCGLVLCEDEDVVSPARIGALITRHQVTHMHFVPGMLDMFMAEAGTDLSSLKQVIASGEALSVRTVNTWYSRTNVPLNNLYGPTEASIDVTSFVTRPGLDIIPIGKPVSNTRLYVLDANRQLLPIGVAGELYIGGVQLAQGYLNRPLLTETSFVDHPFIAGERLYRTGDLVRWQPDGNLVYMGRTDDQVKVRGYRIELGEVEHALLALPDITGASVRAVKDKNGEYNLIGYVISDVPQSSSILYERLLERIPAYMVPGRFMQLSRFPLTASGKVNRQQLPLPEGSMADHEMAYVAPVTPMEEQLVGIWQEVLGISGPISIQADFFRTGGHSLRVMRLVNVYYQQLHIKVTVQELFTHTTIAAQALLLTSRTQSTYEGIEQVPAAADYALSDGQRRLWLLSQQEGGSRAYHISGSIPLEGTYSAALFERAIHHAMARHEILRTVFRENAEGELRQVVLPVSAFRFTSVDATQYTKEEIAAHLDTQATQVFDLSNGPLLRAGLLHTGEQRYILHFNLHHIISDGWSMELLSREVLDYYQCFERGEVPAEAPLRIQYKDYAAWQQQQLSGAGFTADRHYWEEQLSGELPVLALPSEKVRPAVLTYNGYALSTVIDEQTVTDLQALCTRHQSTLFMGLLGVLNGLLYRYSGQEDIIIGSPVAGRGHGELEDQLGFYVNTLALRTRFDGRSSFASLLEAVRGVTLSAYEHQQYPFDRLVDDLNIRRDMSRSVVFDVMMALQQQEAIGDGSAVTGEIMEKGNCAVKLDLHISFITSGGRLYMDMQYNSDVFEKATMVRLMDHFRRLLTQVIATPDMPVSRLAYLSASEEQQLLDTFNDTAVVYPSGVTLQELFQRQVATHGDKVALIHKGQSFNYHQLDTLSGQLCNYLKEKYQVQPGELIGVKLHRSEWLIISLLSVLKTGGAYVPMDPSFPADRIDYILSDSGSRICIDDKLIADFVQQQAAYAGTWELPVTNEDSLAYVLYTSGSTGRPKGCMLGHKGVVNRLEWMWRTYAFTGDDAVLQKTTFTFDVSVWEIFLPLCWGCRLVLCEDEDVVSPARIGALITRHQVTHMHFVPGMLDMFMAEAGTDLSSLKQVIASGEALSVRTVNTWYSRTNVPLNNLYGPTEASIDVTSFVTRPGLDIIPIGKPVSNTRLYVLDANRQLLPVGVAGELYIGGVQLAQGYLNRPLLTETSFVDHPFIAGERLYRTGDLVRWQPDGNLVYMGRTDDQVKVRGYRIELGEVEHALLALPDITGASVRAVKDKNGEYNLIGYVISDVPQSSSVLYERLLERIPAYMVPGRFMQLSRFPLTASGKVNRQQLPLPEGSMADHEMAYVAPVTPMEEQLAGIWQEVLGISGPISIQADFFRTGGHSLRVMRLVNIYHQQLKVKVTVQELFTHTTIAAQALLLTSRTTSAYEEIEQVPEAADYAVSAGQRRLWSSSQFDGTSQAYHLPEVIMLDGTFTPRPFEQAIHYAMARHEILRTVFRENAEGELRQVVLPVAESRFHFSFTDATNYTAEELAAYLQEQQVTPFDLANGPLLRAGLIRKDDTHYILHFNMHHIISDGWSLELLSREILAYYNSYERGEEPVTAPLRIQYKDYAAWQQQQLASDGFAHHRNYWQRQLSGELPVLALPSKKPRPAILTHKGRCLSTVIGQHTVDDFKAVCARYQGTLFMGLLSVLKGLLYRYTGQEDMIIGSPVAGRGHTELEDQIGFYVNTMALRTRFDGSAAFSVLLDAVREVTLSAYDHQQYPFDRLVEDLDLRRDMSRYPLFDIVLVLQSQFDNSTQADAGVAANDTIIDNGPCAVKLDMHISFVEKPDGLHMDLQYNSDVFEQDTIVRLMEHFRRMIHQVTANPEMPVSGMAYMSEAEQHQLLHTFNDTPADYGENKNILDLFAATVKAHANNIAISYKDQQLTFGELDGLSDRMACYLKDQYHICPDDIIVLKLSRSEWMMVAILGILKVGAAYAPVDVNYPQDRIDFIIEDSGSKLIIDETVLQQIQAALQEDKWATAVLPAIMPQQLAYVIYTSGSTGRPKGVQIEHAGLYNHICYCLNVFMPEKEERYTIPLFTSVSFDLTVPSLFCSLLNGGELVIYPQEDAVSDIMEDIFFGTKNINFLKCTPSHIDILGAATLRPSTIEGIIIGGEELKHTHVSLLRSLNKDMRIFNEYGPTEATVGCIVNPLVPETKPASGRSIPIGKPVTNSRIYILDANRRLCPVGITGELYIGGIQLARGYFNRPDLTAERFVADPFIKGKKIYRSGDLACWLPDGNIEYQGRIDDQVKIRGYRIELGEIEHALVAIENISAATVQVKEEADGQKILVGYMVSREPLNVTTLRQQLQERLPEHMIPAYFVQLPALPLTANGKIDKRALPEHSSNAAATGTTYAAPRNSVEEKLVEIFESIFRKQGIGIRDGFIDLGGDSIKAILLASKLKQQGYSIKIGEILKYPTVEQLAVRVSIAQQTEQPDNIEGNVVLTPIQRLFMEKEYPAMHHYNQSVLLYSKEVINVQLLRKCFTALLEHHDALRMVYRKENGGWTQYNKGKIYAADLFDIKEYGPETDPQEMRSHCDQLQESINLTEGPLVKLGLFHLPDGDRLLIIIHHLVVDGVSWRILLEDLSTLYHMLLNGEAPQLPLKSDAFQQWAEKLQQYANSDAALSEMAYWENIAAAFSGKRHRDMPPEETTIVKKSVSFGLDTDATTLLLTRTNKTYRTEINDILLAALGCSIGAALSWTEVLIALEAHGREEILDGVHIGRTVGWFTSIYPLLLQTKNTSSCVDYLITVKEQLRTVPDKGIGYGILRYLRDDKKDILAPLGDTDITFNYLGDFGFGVTSGENNSLFSYSGEYKGQDISSRNIVDRGLTVTGMIVEGRLIMNISYNGNKYTDAQMKSLSDNYENYLKELITTLSDTHEIYLTPSDLTFKGLTMDEISALNNDNNLEDVYRLSPLQEGIYYHWVTDPATTAYVIQSSYRVQGKLDVPALEKSFDCLTNRHAILRSTFHHEYGTDNIQVVRKKVTPDFKHVCCDAAGGDKDQQVDAVKQRDRLQGFDLNNGSQMRLTIFELGNSQYEFIWTHHHILMDGWSSSLLIREFYGIYREIINNREPEPVNVNSYVNYIKWLSSLNTAESHAYWNAYLEGYAHATEMPFKKKAVTDESYQMNKMTIELDSVFMDELHNLCRDQGITENVFFRSCWSYLLGRYNNSNDVVFGAVVSGRSEEVAGIEHMIGLFSNTIPVRVRYEEGSQVKDLLWSVQQEAIHSLPHHFMSLADIQAGKQQRELFDNIFVYENFPVQEIINEELNGAQGLEKLDVLSTSGYIESNYDFTLQIAPIRDVLKITIIYRDSVYSKESVNEMLLHFWNVIKGFMAGVDTELDNITLLSSSDQQALLETDADAAPEDTVVTWFEEKASRRPHTIALIYEAQELSWGELNERANQLARYLRKKGVKRGDVIPLCIDSSPDAIIGIMGILKCGAAYAPIDPSFPQDRVNYILNDIHAEVAVSQEGYRSLLAGVREVVAMDTDHAAISEGATDNIDLPLRAEERLYIIYTSGSTGKPKGVMISHANMLDYIDGLFDNLPMLQCKSFALVSGIFTDLGNTVLYGSLLSGGCLHLFSKDMLNNGFALCQYFEENRIDCVKIVPAHWQALSTGDKLLLPERLLIFGGETLYAEIPQRIYATKPSCLVVNHYGPTETTVGKLLHVVGKNKSYDTVIPIGKPFTNSVIYILSKNMQVVPKGIAGELYIGGKGLASGYWGNEKLTAEFFIPDPFASNGSRMYKTGDLVKQLSDGEIVFLGRADDQVKIRGYRIEPGEIEHALQQAPGVEKGVAVITELQQDGEKELVLYVTGKVDTRELTAYLQDKLPVYMMPAAIIEVPEFPLLSNGKVDRRELAARPLKNAGKVREYIAPQNETEEKLVKIWTEVLNVPGPVGVVDNFFELGGHSIKVIKLLSRVSKQFGVILSVQKVFEEATIRSLAAKIQTAIQSTSAERSTGIPKMAEGTSYPLSSSQRRLWVINALNRESTAYNMPSVIPLSGIYYPDKYEQAIRALTSRHEILRTVFREVEGEVTQWVIPVEEFDHGMIYTDLRMDADKRKTAQQMIQEDRLLPYDLGQAPLFRIRMIQLEDEEYLLYFNIHHIIGDGWSMKILSDDLTYFYECYVKGQAPDLEPLPIQYKDYAGWQQERLASEEFKAHRSYWLEQLSGELPVLSLPAYKSRPAMFTENGHNLYTVINPDVIAQFSTVCQGQQATLFMGLMAVMNGLLYRYTGQEDIIIGSPVVNREHPDLENQIGLYLNTIALRTRFDGADSFSVLLNKVKDTTLAAYEHQVYPFDTLLENLNIRRDMSRSPVFDIMVMLQNQHDRTVSEDQPQVLFGERVVDNGPAVVKFDMSIEFTERGNGLHMAVQFNTDVYEKATIVRFIEHYKRLLRMVAEQPEESIAAQRYLSAAEEDEQLKKFNNTQADFPADKTLVDLFRHQAALAPDNTAIVFEGDKLTYAELDNRSNQLAHYLRKKGVKKDSLVPVCIDRSLEMSIVLLGILKAGAAYVPLDPSYPKDWIAYVIDDLQPDMVLTYSHHEELFTIDQYDLLLMLDNEHRYIMTLPEAAADEHPAPDHLAYAIYTSGSTGKPKGVLIEHHSLLNFLLSVDRLLEVNETSSILAVTTYSFDIAYLELYLMLLKGGTVILSPRAKVTDANLLMQQLEQYQPTHMQATPSTWQMLVESGWKNEEGLVVLTGGEALKRNLRDQLLSLGDNKCWNLYGPTETTIWVTAAELKKQGTVTIGKPFHNASAYILDRQHRLVAKGVTGELYIGGAQLARGYFNREALTAERFIANPFKPGERLYRTGDQARFLGDGTIEYIGREDDQVKVRGYRIELGEVEHALLSLGTIRSASVQAWENESGYKFLVAYVVSEGVVNAQLVRKQLLERIPEYMVPGFFVQLENLPLTANRKVDRKALPNPEGLAISGGTEYVAPRNEVEEKLVAIWKEVFRTNIDIGIKDNYFELGGESMMAIRILARVSKEFGVSISIRKMFEDPRIESIASEILNATWFAKGAANTNGEESENIKL